MVITVTDAQKEKIVAGKMWQLAFKGDAPKQITMGSRHFLSTNSRDARKKFVRVLVLDRKREQLSGVTNEIAKVNGCEDRAEFLREWQERHGAWDALDPVGFITFVVVEEKLRNGRWRTYRHRVFDAGESPSTAKMFEK